MDFNSPNLLRNIDSYQVNHHVERSPDGNQGARRAIDIIYCARMRPHQQAVFWPLSGLASQSSSAQAVHCRVVVLPTGGALMPDKCRPLPRLLGLLMFLLHLQGAQGGWRSTPGGMTGAVGAATSEDGSIIYASGWGLSTASVYR